MSRRLTALALVALGGLAAAQQDASNRLMSAPGPPRRAVYDMATGTLRPDKGPVAFFGPDVIYNNSCLRSSILFAPSNPMEVFVDNGQVPSSTSPLPPGCHDVQLMNGFTFGYCAAQPVVDLRVRFYELHENCTDPQLSTGSSQQYFVGGLPGTMTGVPMCWLITVDLQGTSMQWPFLADGNGVYDGVSGLDTFGVEYEVLNVMGPPTGMMLAGDPVHFGQGCDFAVGSVYQVTDPTGSAPNGTGHGSVDSFGLVQGGLFAGCFLFGGWPANPWSSFYLTTFAPDAGCDVGGQVFCIAQPGLLGGSITCPCGNSPTNGPVAGCAHQTTTGVGGKLGDAPGTGKSVSSEDLVLAATTLAVGNGGLFFVGTGELATPLGIEDGVLCVGGSPLVGSGTLRLNPGFETGPGFRLSNPPGPTSLIGEGNAITPGYFVSGTTYYWQYFFRDANLSGDPGGPCGGFANLTNGWTTTLTP